MTQFSHSRVECFKKCPFQYRMRYIDKIKTLPNTDSNNALILGQAVHTGIEKGVEAAIKEYYGSYPIITDAHINEVMKLEYLIPKVKAALPDGIFEKQIITSDYIGFMDLLVPVDDTNTVFDLYDFKYSNNVKNYLNSEQLHLYKYFYEKMTGHVIRDLYYVFVPKIQIRQKKTEDLYQFRQRLMGDLKKSEVKIVQIQYDPEKVIEFLQSVKQCLESKDYPKNEQYLCNWCEYQDYCVKGWDYMLLPQNKRRNIEAISKKVIWIYGAPFSGKTYLANNFPDPLMLNTDGNIKFIDAPYLPIKDIVKTEGRMTKRTLAWDVFKDAIFELEKKDNDFKTIVVDLLEDTYEACRIYMYDKLGIEHESDNSFKAWDMVRTEFLSTLKRLMGLDYENIILISHEDSSRDLAKKSGDKITAIKPNLQDKCANKVAGMVDIVARVISDGEVRTLSFKTNEVIFGGGRLTVKSNEIPLEYDALMKVYDEANKGKKAAVKPEPKPEEPKEEVAPVTEGEGTAEAAKDAELKVANEDMYFHHPESDSYFMIKQGEPFPNDPDFEFAVSITKRKYNKAIKDEEAQAAEAESKDDVEETVNDSVTTNDEAVETVNEEPKRQRRSRKPRD